MRVRSFCKVNLGLTIGERRPDDFHDLMTVYQSINLYDEMELSYGVHESETRIEITSNDPRVPTDERNTVWKAVKSYLDLIDLKVHVHVHIDKRLPIHGGLGAGSANAAVILDALIEDLGTWDRLKPETRMELAAGVGFDVPFFLVGGMALGLGRGEIIVPLPDMPPTPCVIAIPDVGVSTDQAFFDWDKLSDDEKGCTTDEETLRSYAARLAEPDMRWSLPKNCFEEVVFERHHELREINELLCGRGMKYGGLAGAGSCLFGLYVEDSDARAAQDRLQAAGVEALWTRTLPREEYKARIED